MGPGPGGREKRMKNQGQGKKIREKGWEIREKGRGRREKGSFGFRVVSGAEGGQGRAEKVIHEILQFRAWK
jgi:hypothetical protein